MATIHKVLQRNRIKLLGKRSIRKPFICYSRPIPGDRIQVDTCKIAPGLYQYTAIAGHYAAQQDIKRLGIEETTVGIGRHRNPVWPAGLVGSITHTTTQAICAVTKNTDYQSISIELADLIPLVTANDIKDHIIQKHEISAFKHCPFSFEQSLTFTFSAKESLFKAPYLQVEAYFEFHAAEICEIEMRNRTFLIRLTQDLTDSLVKDTVFKGNFKMHSNAVSTSIFITHL